MTLMKVPAVKNNRIFSLIILMLVLLFSYLLMRKLFFTPEPVVQNNAEAPASSGYINLDNVNKVSVYRGKVYVNSDMGKEDASHKLLDEKGDLIIYLTTTDAKLKLAEGMFVQLSGKVTSTKDGKSSLLNVTTISFK